MVTFNQQGQVIHGNQTIIGSVDFSGAKSLDDLSPLLQQLLEQIQKAQSDGTLDKDSAEEAERSIVGAKKNLTSTEPDKGKVLRYLNTAKDWVSSTTGLATAVDSAIATVRELLG